MNLPFDVPARASLPRQSRIQWQQQTKVSRPAKIKPPHPIRNNISFSGKRNLEGYEFTFELTNSA
jgi:hypothetical protein